MRQRNLRTGSRLSVSVRLEDVRSILFTQEQQQGNFHRGLRWVVCPPEAPRGSRFAYGCVPGGQAPTDACQADERRAGKGRRAGGRRRRNAAAPCPPPWPALRPRPRLCLQAAHAGLTQAPRGECSWGERKAPQRRGQSCFTAPWPSSRSQPSRPVFTKSSLKRISPAEKWPLWSPSFLETVCSGSGSLLWVALPPGSPSRLTGRGEHTGGASAGQRSQRCHCTHPGS